MTETLWAAVAPTPAATRLIVTRGPREAILKAHLRTNPHHPRALATFLEALALWEGRAVRAALVADEHTTTSGSSLFRDFVPEPEPGPLFTVDVVWDRARPRTRDGLSGFGDFRDLRRLITEELAR